MPESAGGIAGMSVGARMQGWGVRWNAFAIFRHDLSGTMVGTSNSEKRKVSGSLIDRRGGGTEVEHHQHVAGGHSGRFPVILLVGKEDSFRDLVKNVIMSKGYSVLTAKDGREAIRLFSRLHANISLVFADVRLPRLGCQDLLKGMRRIDPNVRVLFSGAYIDQELKSELMCAGAMDCIEGPQGSKQILGGIQDILDR